MKYIGLAVLSLLGISEASKRHTHEGVRNAFLKSTFEGEYIELDVTKRPKSFRNGKIECDQSTKQVVLDYGDGNSNTYGCDGVDFLSFMGSEELMIPGRQYQHQSSDIWGWLDTVNEREITLLTLDTGVVFIDSTDAENPCIISKARSRRTASPWGDIKVVGNFAYAIKDRNNFVSPRFEDAPGTGMEVYNLTLATEGDCHSPDYVVKHVDPVYVIPDMGNCHNVVSNTESKRIYAVGCRDTCDGGFVAYDVSNNNESVVPTKIGCVSGDGYTHDAQCVLYTGPDKRYSGREICFAFNEDTLTIWDLTKAHLPVMVSRTVYVNSAYSHQGWLNRDMTKVFLNDELDEECGLDSTTDNCKRVIRDLPNFNLQSANTRTRVFNVEDLTNPQYEDEIVAEKESIDHNLYFWGPIHERGWGGNAPLEKVPSYDLVYMNNYMDGLQIWDTSDSSNYSRVKYFDVTEETAVEFFGVWSGYMHPSGVYAMSSIERGLFFVQAETEETFVDALAFDVPDPVDLGEEETEDESGSASPVLYVFFFIFLAGTAFVGYMMFSDSKKAKKEAKTAENEKLHPASL